MTQIPDYLFIADNQGFILRQLQSFLAHFYNSIVNSTGQ